MAGTNCSAGIIVIFSAPKLWAQLKKIAHPVRAGIWIPRLSRVPASFWHSAARALPSERSPILVQSCRKLFVWQRQRGAWTKYIAASLMSGAVIITGLGGQPIAHSFDLDVGAGASDTIRMMYCDAVSYLPDDIPGESRSCLDGGCTGDKDSILRSSSCQLAARISLDAKVRGIEGKRILRKMLYELVPRGLVDRPKAGFAVPVGEWIKGPLRGWAEDLLDVNLIRSPPRKGYLDPSIVRSRWQQHLSGRRNSTPALWAILMFQSWLLSQTTGRPPSSSMAIAG